MKFSIAVSMGDPGHYLPLAKAAEAAGFHAMAIPDSLFYPEETIGEYPYHEGREFLEDKPFLDPFVIIPAMAAVTERLHFDTFVLKMAVREPVLVAKAAQSAAVLSHNRLTLGVGLSPWYEDFAYCNTPWDGRGGRFDEMLEIFRGLGSGDYFEFHGKHFDFKRIKMCPVPDKPVGLIVGGHSKAALRRAARLGDGWVSANVTRDELKGMLTTLSGFRAEFGTDARDDFRIQAMLSDVELFDPAEWHTVEAIGVDETILTLWGTYDVRPIGLDEKLELIGRFGREVIDRY